MNPSDNIQLAKTVDMESIIFPARAEVKLDGGRLILYEGKIYTRNNKRVHLPVTENKVTDTDHVADIEVTFESGKMCERSSVNGLINSAIAGNPIDESRLWFNIIDAQPLYNYNNKIKSLTYLDRLPMVDLVVGVNREINFRKIPYKDVHSLEELRSYYTYLLDNGYEGVVVKHYEDYYTFGRSKQWARFKATKTADLLCVDTTEGAGNREGGIGALILTGEVEGKLVRVKAGSGMKLTKDVFRPHSYYVGKTIEVKYNSVTQDKSTGQYSLFLPRFVCVREDK